MKIINPVLILAIVILISTLSIVEIKSQKFKVLTKSVNIVDNKLVVDYEITKSAGKQSFKVWLEIKNSSGTKLNVKSVSGNVGDNIPSGNKKQIIWDFLADNIVIDDNIGIEVKAEIMSKRKEISNIPTGKALLLSAVVPGLGLTKIKDKKFYLIFSAVTYGTAIFSYVSNKNAFNNYNEYLNGNKTSAESTQYSQSISQKSMSNALAYTAIGSWTINMIWTYLAASKSNKSISNIYNNQKLLFATGINPYSKKPVFTLLYNF